MRFIIILWHLRSDHVTKCSICVNTDYIAPVTRKIDCKTISPLCIVSWLLCIRPGNRGLFIRFYNIHQESLEKYADHNLFRQIFDPEMMPAANMLGLELKTSFKGSVWINAIVLIPFYSCFYDRRVACSHSHNNTSMTNFNTLLVIVFQGLAKCALFVSVVNGVLLLSNNTPTYHCCPNMITFRIISTNRFLFGSQVFTTSYVSQWLTL